MVEANGSDNEEEEDPEEDDPTKMLLLGLLFALDADGDTDEASIVKAGDEEVPSMDIAPVGPVAPVVP